MAKAALEIGELSVGEHRLLDPTPLINSLAIPYDSLIGWYLGEDLARQVEIPLCNPEHVGVREHLCERRAVNDFESNVMLREHLCLQAVPRGDRDVGLAECIHVVDLR